MRVSSARGLRLSLLAAVAAAGLGAPAPAQDQRTLQRLNAIEAEVRELRQRLGLPPGAGGTSGGQVSVRIDRLERELSELTGRVEALQFEMNRMAEDGGRRLFDLEFRIIELEDGDISVLGAPTPLGQTRTAAGPGAVAPPRQFQVPVGERQDFERAKADAEATRYDVAEERMLAFVNTYPQSLLAGEAYAILGDVRRARGDPQGAARAYLEGYRLDEEGPDAARNLLGLGQTLGVLGQRNEACLTLGEVQTRYPERAEDAAAARSSLACEG